MMRPRRGPGGVALAPLFQYRPEPLLYADAGPWHMIPEPHLCAAVRAILPPDHRRGYDALCFAGSGRTDPPGAAEAAA